MPGVCPVWGFGGSGCPGDWLWPSLPLQYGMLLYQNYRIPQQRKAMLSSFSTPVVSQAAPLKPHSSSAAASVRAVGIFSQWACQRSQNISPIQTYSRFPGDGLCHLSSVTVGSLSTLSPFPHLPTVLLWWMAPTESCILVFRNVDSSAHVYWGAAFTTFASVHFSQGVHGAADHDAWVLAKTEIVVSLPVISGWTLYPRGAETLHPPQIWS